jgi:hypothetical protein
VKIAPRNRPAERTDVGYVDRASGAVRARQVEDVAARRNVFEDHLGVGSDGAGRRGAPGSARATRDPRERERRVVDEDNLTERVVGRGGGCTEQYGREGNTRGENDTQSCIHGLFPRQVCKWVNYEHHRFQRSRIGRGTNGQREYPCAYSFPRQSRNSYATSPVGDVPVSTSCLRGATKCARSRPSRRRQAALLCT